MGLQSDTRGDRRVGNLCGSKGGGEEGQRVGTQTWKTWGSGGGAEGWGAEGEG